jgi:hypothetical protein
MAASVSSLSLEAYLTLLDALTGAGSPRGTVRAVSAIEEPFFRVGDLRQVLLLHGLAPTGGKLVRGDALRSMVGARLLDPTAPPQAADTGGGAAAAARPQQQASAGAGGGSARVTAALQAADLVALGWASDPPEALQAALQEAPALELSRLPPAAPSELPASGRDAEGAVAPPAPDTAAPAPVPPLSSSGPVPRGAPAGGQAGAGGLLSAAGGRATASTAPGALAGAPLAPDADAAKAPLMPAGLDQRALLALLQQHGLLPTDFSAGGTPAAAHGPAAGAVAARARGGRQQPGGACSGAGAVALEEAPAARQEAPLPEYQHSAWLRQQLAIFEGVPGCRSAAGEELEEGSASALAGRRVAFVLGSEMEVAAGRGAVLKLPSGLFQVGVGSRGLWSSPSAVLTTHSAPVAMPCGAWRFARATCCMQRLHRACGARMACNHHACTLKRHAALARKRHRAAPRPACAPLLLPQGRAIRFLGTACRPALCEPTCGGGHFFYNAKIIPPPPGALAAMAAAAAASAAAADRQALSHAAGAPADGGAAAAGGAPGARAAEQATAAQQDYAAALGRPIELELDLHPRLRRRATRELLLLDGEALQALGGRGDPAGPKRAEARMACAPLTLRAGSGHTWMGHSWPRPGLLARAAIQSPTPQRGTSK